jgi:hypothetical protein
VHDTGATREDRELLQEADAVQRVRLERMRALSPAERVEHLHVLCAQVAELATRPVDERP